MSFFLFLYLNLCLIFLKIHKSFIYIFFRFLSKKKTKKRPKNKKLNNKKNHKIKNIKHIKNA